MLPEVEKLRDQIDQLIAEDKIVDAIPLVEKSARLLVAGGELEEATFAFVTAARLRIGAEQLAEAMALVDEAQPTAEAAGPAVAAELFRLRGELVEATGDVDAARAAWTRAAATGAGETRVLAMIRLAELAQLRGDSAAALEGWRAVLATPEAAGDPALERDAHLALARCFSETRAFADAEREIALASQIEPEDPSGRAKVLGERALLAAAQGEVEGAMHSATLARQAAVEAQDVMAYLSTSFLISGLHERNGQPIEAYDALVRAQASLKDLVGDEGAQMVAPALEEFARRMGADFAAVQARWVAARRGERG